MLMMSLMMAAPAHDKALRTGHHYSLVMRHDKIPRPPEMAKRATLMHLNFTRNFAILSEMLVYIERCYIYCSICFL